MGKKRQVKSATKSAKKTEKETHPVSESEDEKHAEVSEDNEVVGSPSTDRKRKRDMKNGHESGEDESDEDFSPVGKKTKSPAKTALGKKKAAPKTLAKGSGRPKRSATTPKPNTKKTKEPESDETDPEAEYEVDRILEYKKSFKGEQYLIKWKGYPLSRASWEPKSNLDCQEKLDAFHEKLDLDNLPRSRRLTTSSDTLASKNLNRVRKNVKSTEAVKQQSNFKLLSKQASPNGNNQPTILRPSSSRRRSASTLQTTTSSVNKSYRNMRNFRRFAVATLVLSMGAGILLSPKISWQHVQPQLQKLLPEFLSSLSNIFKGNS